jgi:hypothetical protein
MKYIQYTLVGNKTNIPVSVEPAKYGPKHPDGVVPTFSIESSYETGVPTFFGIAEDTFEPEEWMRELNEEEFYATMRKEFKDRARVKQKQVECGGFWISPEMFVRTDGDTQNRLAQLVTSINNDPEILTVDFEVDEGQWQTLDRDTVLAIGKTISKHVRDCFSWCKTIHEQLDAALTLEEMLPVVQDIASFKANDNPPVEQPTE